VLPSIAPDTRDYLSIIDMSDVFSLEHINVSAGEMQATITWTTDLPTTSKVEYSTSLLFNETFVYAQSIDFHYWDLLPGTMYYFHVQSEGSKGIATSKVLTFTTAGGP